MRVAVIGLGLLGGSWALALRAVEPDWPVAGFDPSPDTRALAADRGAITAIATSPAAAVEEARLVVIATPVLAVGEVLDAIAPHLAPGAVVTDVASTKGQVMAWAAERLPAHATFVGGHPMAGSERQGMAHASADLLVGAPYCLTPADNGDPAAVGLLAALVRRMGAFPLPVPADAHDEAVATISHVPFLVSAAIAASAAEDPTWPLAARLAATGFRDMTRLAGAEPGVHRDIALTNAEAIAPRLRDLASRLRHLADTLEDPALLTPFLEGARAERQRWMREHGSKRGYE